MSEEFEIDDDLRAIDLYCGCCGREIVQGVQGATGDWCMDCLREHVDTNASRPEEATFFAQHGRTCPFEQAGGV